MEISRETHVHMSPTLLRQVIVNYSPSLGWGSMNYFRFLMSDSLWMDEEGGYILLDFSNYVHTYPFITFCLYRFTPVKFPK